MKLILIFLLLLSSAAYGQTNEARQLFLVINLKRAELQYPKLSYIDTRQTELDQRALKIGMTNTAAVLDSCECTSENVFSADSFRGLLKTAINPAHDWHHMDPKQRNATISVVNMDGMYYAVIRTY